MRQKSSGYCLGAYSPPSEPEGLTEPQPAFSRALDNSWHLIHYVARSFSGSVLFTSTNDGGLDEAVKLIFFGVVPQIDLHQSDSNM